MAFPLPAGFEDSAAPAVSALPAAVPVNPFAVAAPPQETQPLIAKQRRAEEQASSVEANEKDMYDGPLLRELGIDFPMISRKLVACMPFTKVSEEVAISGDMLVGAVCLLSFSLLSALTASSRARFGLLFGLLLYGTLFLQVLLNLLLQGSVVLDVYTVASAMSYGFVPVLGASALCAVLRPVLASGGAISKGVLGALYCLGGAAFGFSATKLLNAATGLVGVRLLVGFPAMLLASCYVLLLAS